MSPAHPGKTRGKLLQEAGPADMERYSDYDPFAWLYATHWGAEYHEQALAVLDQLILNQLPPRRIHSRPLLRRRPPDCALHAKGFDVVGIDGSECMLEFARTRCPEVPFIAADARTFETDRRFDLVLSTFDALNHVMTPDGFRSVCLRAYDAVQPGGYFAFDLNREEAYTDLWSQTSAQVEPDMVSVAIGTVPPRDRVADCYITLFRLIAERLGTFGLPTFAVLPSRRGCVEQSLRRKLRDRRSVRCLAGPGHVGQHRERTQLLPGSARHLKST